MQGVPFSALRTLHVKALTVDSDWYCSPLGVRSGVRQPPYARPPCRARSPGRSADLHRRPRRRRRLPGVPAGLLGCGRHPDRAREPLQELQCGADHPGRRRLGCVRLLA